jgi:hypothetical protein
MDWINEDGTRCDPQPDADAQVVLIDQTPTCAIGGVFVVGKRMAACTRHGCGNRCFDPEPCEHKVPNDPAKGRAESASRD